jgi:hypothetical protein
MFGGEDARAKRVVLHRGGGRHQATVEQKMARTRLTQTVTTSILPAMLRVPRYDDAVRGEASPGDSSSRFDSRRDPSSDSNRRGAVVLSEAALRSPVGSASVMLDQVEHLAAQAHRPNLAVGVVPLRAVLPSAIHCGFEIHDHQMVAVHVTTGSLIMTDPKDVRTYQDQFRGLHGRAVFGTDAHQVLRMVIEDYEEIKC